MVGGEGTKKEIRHRKEQEQRESDYRATLKRVIQLEIELALCEPEERLRVFRELFSEKTKAARLREQLERN
jgi:hypothetical protein